MTIQSIFKKECEEIGVDFREFPFCFQEGIIHYEGDVISAMFWVLKKRQDKILAEAAV